MFEVRLLGPVEVWEGNRRAPLGGSRPLAVLGALVVHLGEVVSTERLVDLVWDERAPATAGALVATHVSAARRALNRIGVADVIRTRPRGYVVDLDPGRVDARRFEQLLAGARLEAAGGRPADAVDVLAEALGLWRGQEALEGLGQSFARIESARLAELRLVAHEESFALRLELGRADETIAPLLAHVAAHPLRERARGQLMTALFRTGRLSDALRTYQEGRTLLRDELGIDPGPELRALHQALLTNDTDLPGSPPGRSPAAGRGGDAPSPARGRSTPAGPRTGPWTGPRTGTEWAETGQAGPAPGPGAGWHQGPSADAGADPPPGIGAGADVGPGAAAGPGAGRHPDPGTTAARGWARHAGRGANTDPGEGRHHDALAAGEPAEDGHHSTGAAGRPAEDGHHSTGAAGEPAEDGHHSTGAAGEPAEDGHHSTGAAGEPAEDGHHSAGAAGGPEEGWHHDTGTAGGHGPDQLPGRGPDRFPGQAPGRVPGQRPDRHSGQPPERYSGQGQGPYPGQGGAGAAGPGSGVPIAGAAGPGSGGPFAGAGDAPAQAHAGAGPGEGHRGVPAGAPVAGVVPGPRTEPVPSHLPPDIADFVGRAEQAAWAVGVLRGAGGAGRTAPPIGVISGRSGTGKTALAVHVGHRTAELFPDGRLFIDLRAADATPLQPADALARLLRAMGAGPRTLPAGLEELTGLYRTHIGHRRVLLILDNAAGEAHVRPLLPPGPGSAVLVTSRRRLVALEGAAHLDLAVPDERDALELLRRVAGNERTGAEPDQAAEIVALCGRLPLAVRIAGARLAARPHWPPGRLAGRLRDERRRLNELSAGDLELRSSLELGYQDLAPPERRALRRLALLDLPDFAAWVAAPLLDIGTDDAEEAVERLVDCHFIDVLGVDGTGRTRYRIHDLAREHARERCLSEEGAEERAAAVLRLVACWLDLARKAAARGPGGAARHFPEPAAVRALDPETEESLLARPAAWFAAEQAGLLAAAVHCADHQHVRAARDLAGALMAGSAALYNRFDAWSRSHTAAMTAVRRGGDTQGEAWLLSGLGQLRYEQDDFDASYAYFADALRLFEEPPGTPAGAARALAGMGTARREQARYDEASALLRASLEHYGPAGGVDDSGARARVLYGLGYVHREQGRTEAARQALTEALELYRAAADRHGEGLTLRSLALCHRAEDEHAEAERVLGQVLEIFGELQDTFGTMYTEQSLAKVELRTGRPGRASERLGRCLEVARERRDRFGEALVLRTLGEAHLADGDPAGAREPLERALALWEELRLPLWRARTLWDMAQARAASGEEEEEEEAARGDRAEALAVFRALGCREAMERG
ncbi:BTAD domain-containing putative transcriptional regulator [Streptomyces sp. L2]|uniref:BTAD domain-containing putative transcriptional regulator n=1 Tax=Streptomyces sp. L2 TaxID=2162665 RepID=UPI001F51570F|nr:BTAD domain-containing putative transcriptional regulator [Streptomyces sp. L2]